MAATVITHPLDTLTCRLIQDFGDKNKLFINLYSYKVKLLFSKIKNKFYNIGNKRLYRKNVNTRKLSFFF